VQAVLNNWHSIIQNASGLNHGFIVLEHDLFQESVEVATGYILPDALAHQPALKIEPVVTCLNKPLSDAYIETNNNKTNPPAQSGASDRFSLSTLQTSSSRQDRPSRSLQVPLAPYKQLVLVHTAAVLYLFSNTALVLPSPLLL
jgi:hypothetical protein